MMAHTLYGMARHCGIWILTPKVEKKDNNLKPVFFGYHLEFSIKNFWIVTNLDFDTSINIKLLIARNPDYLYAYMGLTAAYWFDGSEERARQAARQVLMINPQFSIRYYENLALLKDEELRDKLFHAWRQAGLK